MLIPLPGDKNAGRHIILGKLSSSSNLTFPQSPTLPSSKETDGFVGTAVFISTVKKQVLIFPSKRRNIKIISPNTGPLVFYCEDKY